MRTRSIILAATAAAGLLLTGCGEDPCQRLSAPTPAELAAAAAGADVEREVGTYDCDLVNGRWTQEVD